MAGAAATLYVIPGSHACRTAMLLLEHKGVPYRVRELPSGLHPIAVRLLGFPGHRAPIRTVEGLSDAQMARLDRLGTVPALRHQGHRIQTNTAIVEYLERLAPQPPLYPADPGLSSRVEQARRFGDETFQMAARRAVLAAGADGLEQLHRHGGEGRLGALLAHSDRVRLMASRSAGRFAFRATASRSSALAAATVPLLDRIDAWVAEGVLGGERLNAADLTIVPSLALLDYRLDMRRELRWRPCYDLLERVLPEPA